MRTKQTLLNLRPHNRINQSGDHDESPETSDCEFALSKPIHFKDYGKFHMRNAYVPVTYKNVIEGYNDRFAICLRPTQAATDNKSVFITVQIPVGQYDTVSALATAINTVLAETSDSSAFTNPSALDVDGDVEFSYTSSYTGKVLSAAITCSVDTSAKYKNHLKFTLPSCTFHSTSVTTKDGTSLLAAHGDAGLDGGMQIVFGLIGSPKHSVNTRHAAKMLGFGREKAERRTQTVDTTYPFSPSTTVDTSGNGQDIYSDLTANMVLTPYVYVRCDLARQSVETVNRTTRQTDLIGKIPITSSGYGDVNFYEADNEKLEFILADGTIQNVRIVLTDADGRRLNLGDNEWEIGLVFEGLQD